MELNGIEKDERIKHYQTATSYEVSKKENPLAQGIIALIKEKHSIIQFSAFLLFLCFSLFITSCVYFNTFYNAQKYFESAQRIAVPETGRPTSRALQDYDKVIEKCTYIVREHPDSKWADDALFLLARSVYYKRQNILQAKERFNDLIRVFTNSEHIPQSYIYIARIDYQLNNRDEAFRNLNNILSNPNYSKYHAKVLLIKSEWYLAQGDNERAQQNLSQIIKNYPRSEEYDEAYLNLGMSYLNNEEYKQSKQTFESLLNTRIARRIRFNARYYVALNNFYLKDYDTVLAQVDRLIRDEYEPTMFPRLYLLQARTYAAKKEYELAESLFKSIIEENRRTLISAEASYHLAEMYFLILSSYEQAIEYYNYVSTESRTSPFVEKAMGRSSVVSQILQLDRGIQTMDTHQLVQEQFKLAEYYLYVMNVPDSALSVYRSIEKHERKLRQRKVELDSLLLEIELESPVEEDSLLYEEAEFTPQETEIEELFTTEVGDIIITDDVDSLDYSYHREMLIRDYNGIIMEEGDLFHTTEPPVDLDGVYGVDFTYNEDGIISSEDTLLVIDDPYTNLLQEKANLQEALNLYQTEFIPYSLFLSAWVLVNKLNDLPRAQLVFDKLQENYTDTVYLYAAKQLLSGEEVEFAYPIELQKEKEYEEILQLLKEDREEGFNRLSELYEEISITLSEDTTHTYSRLQNLYNKTAFTLGISYYFDFQDSTNAREYFDELLQTVPDSDYSRFITNFYVDNHFVVLDSLTFTQVEPDTLKDERVQEDDSSSTTTIIEDDPHQPRIPPEQLETTPQDILTPPPEIPFFEDEDI